MLGVVWVRAVCCNVLQCVAMCCSVLSCAATVDGTSNWDTGCCNWGTGCCMSCCVLYDALGVLWQLRHWVLHELLRIVWCIRCAMATEILGVAWASSCVLYDSLGLGFRCSVLQCVAVCCSVLQCVASCMIHWVYSELLRVPLMCASICVSGL